MNAHQKFTAVRKRLGLSVPQLAKVLNVPIRTLYRWEETGPHGRRPHPIAVRALEWFAAGYRPKDWPFPK